MGLSQLTQGGEQRECLREDAQVREQELNNVVHMLHTQREHGHAQFGVQLREEAAVHHAGSEAK